MQVSKFRVFTIALTVSAGLLISGNANAQFSNFLDKLKKNTGDLLDRVDAKDDGAHVQRALRSSISSPRAGQVFPWENPYNGHKGEITLKSSAYGGSGEQCWEYTRTLTEVDAITRYSGKVCQPEEDLDSGTSPEWSVTKEIKDSRTEIAKAVEKPAAPVQQIKTVVPKKKARPVPNKTVREAQHKLAQLGFNAGTPDGLYGRKTRQAIREYQKTRGLIVDGRASPILVARLSAEITKVTAVSAPTAAAPSPALTAPTPVQPVTQSVVAAKSANTATATRGAAVGPVTNGMQETPATSALAIPETSKPIGKQPIVSSPAPAAVAAIRQESLMPTPNTPTPVNPKSASSQMSPPVDTQSPSPVVALAPKSSESAPMAQQPATKPEVVSPVVPPVAAQLAARPASTQNTPKPTFRNPDGVAVIIGNRIYSHERVPEVKFAHRDAEAFKRYVIDVLGFEKENIIDLRDASQAEILATFGNERNHQGKVWSYLDPGGKSDVVVYYSGHGVPGQRSGRGYLLPSNASPDSAEINGYPIDLLYANLGKLKAAKSVRVFLDACFSGDSPNGMLIQSASPVFVKAALPAAAGKLTVLTAASGTQLASWDQSAKHGLFTQHLMDALYGKADANSDGSVTSGEVKSYLDRNLTRAARRQFGRIQEANLNGADNVTLSGKVGGVFPSRPTELKVVSLKPENVAPAATAVPAMVTSNAPIVIPEGARDEKAIRLTRSDRALIQLGLNSMRLDAGPPDGLFGPKTRVAIKVWQGAKGFKRTGYLVFNQAGVLIAQGKRVMATRNAPVQQQRQAQNNDSQVGAEIVKGIFGVIINRR